MVKGGENIKYPNECCRCGYCCLVETCKIGQSVYGVGKKDACLGLTFEGSVASCGIARRGHKLIVGIGAGCCIKARAIKDGVTYDFASLPESIKRIAANDLRKKREKINAGFLDDFGSIGKIVRMTRAEMLRRNQEIENEGMEEYGYWVEVAGKGVECHSFMKQDMDHDSTTGNSRR